MDAFAAVGERLSFAAATAAVVVLNNSCSNRSSSCRNHCSRRCSSNCSYFEAGSYSLTAKFYSFEEHSAHFTWTNCIWCFFTVPILHFEMVRTHIQFAVLVKTSVSRPGEIWEGDRGWGLVFPGPALVRGFFFSFSLKEKLLEYSSLWGFFFYGLLQFDPLTSVVLIYYKHSRVNNSMFK